MSQLYLQRALAGLVLVLMLWGCQSVSLNGNKVATVNGQVITKKEFKDSFARHSQLRNVDPKMFEDPKFEPVMQMFKKMTLQKMIVSALILQEAEKHQLEVTSEELDKFYKEHAAQMGDESALENRLKEMGISVTDFKDELKNELLKEKLVGVISDKSFVVSDEEAKTYFQTNPQRYQEPEKVRARHILISANPNEIKQSVLKENKGATPDEINTLVEQYIGEKRKKAQDLLSKIKTNPTQFETLARENSEDPGSAKVGGDLGYFAKGVMVQPFSDAAFSLQSGQLAKEPVETTFGFHIIQTTDRKPAKKHTYNDVKKDIVSFLENRKKTKVLDKWLEEKQKISTIVIEPEYDFEAKEQNNSNSVKLPVN